MKRRRILRIISTLLIILIGVELFAYFRPLPPAKASLVNLNLTPQLAVNMPWPATGQAAFGTLSDGLLAANNDTKPVPIASTAKVITALAVLKQKPLTAGSQGPTITLGPADVATYNQFYAEGGSVAAVYDGEQITEYQMLEAMLLPSANNMAVSLATWAFGSEQNYLTYANNFAKTLGMNSTTITDPSGFDPGTVSTASDMVHLAQAAINDPTVLAIAGLGDATVPVAGTVRNTNWLLGNDGVIGIKTGNTDQAGGCYVFAAKRQISDREITVLGAILGDTTLNQAIIDGDNLVQAGDHNFRIVFVAPNQTVATYKTKWGTTATAVAKNNAHIIVWVTQPVKDQAILTTPRGVQATGTQVGSLQLSGGGETASTAVVLKTAIQKPPISWRLTHF